MRIRQWQAFLRKASLDVNLPFLAVYDAIMDRLWPIYEEISRR
jgi:hypothetical protein